MALVVLNKSVADALNGVGLTSQQQKALKKCIDNIRDADYNVAMHHEKVGSKDQISSFRFGRKGRLLAKRIACDSEPVWVLLQALPNHDYHKSPFIKAGYTELFIEKNKQQITAALSQVSGDGVVEPELSGVKPSSLGVISLTEMSIYQKQVIDMSAKQQACLTELLRGLMQKRFGAVVAGAPGAGKTLLALSLAEAIAQDNATRSKPQRIIYVTESSLLRQEMKKQWRTSAACTADNADTLTVLSYKKLLQRLGVLSGDYAIAKKTQLQRNYLAQQAAKLRELRMTSSQGGAGVRCSVSVDELSAISADQFYQETLVMAAVTDLSDYQAMGSSHSLYHGQPALQAMLWQMFRRYELEKVDARRVDLQTMAVDSAMLPANTVLVVDEALDLSRVQMTNLMAMAPKAVFLGDHNQDLTHISHSLEYLKQSLSKRYAGHVYVAKLAESYRCTAAVAKVATNVLAFKKLVTVHGSDMVDTVVSSARGAEAKVVSWLNSAAVSGLRQMCRSADTAIICSREKKADYAKQLDTPLVFSVDEIKGLGFKRIVLCDLISVKTAQRLLAIIQTGKVKRDQIRSQDRSMIESLNALFTAITRSEAELVLLQTKSHPAITQLFEKLLQGVAVSRSLAGLDAEDAVSKAEWLRQYQRLKQHGKMEQANAIAKRFGLFDEAAKPKPASKPKALALTVPQASKKASELQNDAAYQLEFSYDIKRSRLRRSKSIKRAVDCKNLTADDLTFLSELPNSMLKAIKLEHVLAILLLNRKVDASGEDLTKPTLLFLKKLTEASPNCCLGNVRSILSEMDYINKYDSLACGLLIKAEARLFLMTHMFDMLLHAADMIKTVRKLLFTGLIKRLKGSHLLEIQYALLQSLGSHSHSQMSFVEVIEIAERHSDITNAVGPFFEVVSRSYNHAFTAILRRGCYKVAEVLLASGYDITGLPDKGDYILHDAVNFEDSANKAVTWLVEHGLYVNEVNQLGETPLSLAIKAKNISMVKHLLELGADANAGLCLLDYEMCGIDRMSPLAYANLQGFDEAVSLLLSLPEIDVNGGGYECTGELSHLSPLQIAIVESNAEAVKQLLAHPKIAVARTVVDSEEGRVTLLYYASKHSSQAVVELLAEYEAAHPLEKSDAAEPVAATLSP